jgi:uncharacterized protein (TIGR02145 family)
MKTKKVSLFLTVSLLASIISLYNSCKEEAKENTPPNAVFSVIPSTGTVDTVFAFDASGCSDAEDPVSSLQVRWDWENNGVWDSDWSSDKTLFHQFDQQGDYTVAMEVKDSGGIVDSEAQQLTVTSSGGGNALPVAAFTGSPTGGIAPLTVNFTDQSANSPTSWLWDFGDGGMSTQQNPSHTYYTSGTHSVGLFVTNSYGTDTKMMNDYISVNVGASTGEPCPGTPTFAYEGQTYNTVLIGSQCWMKENLNYATENSWCYDNNPSNCDTYGRLYDWAVIMNGEFSSNKVPSGVQGICPPGWHIPSDAEWDIMINYLGGSSVAGGKMKETGYAHWNSPNTDATNESGFTALPGGFYSSIGTFSNLNEISWFWSCTNYNLYYGWSRTMDYNASDVIRFGSGKDYGYSLRCIKD